MNTIIALKGKDRETLDRIVHGLRMHTQNYETIVSWFCKHHNIPREELLALAFPEGVEPSYAQN